MNLEALAHRLSTQFQKLALDPVRQLLRGLNADERQVLYALLALAVVAGFVLGRRRSVRRVYRPIIRRPHRPTFGGWRFPTFQNRGEAQVSRVLRAHFGPPDAHLMNHVTLRMEDGTTQVDHILVARGGVFVIETKDYTGWIFGDGDDATWTQVHFRRKSKFQNPIRQNYRHVCAVRNLLDFVPPEAIISIVVFSGDAEFKTEIPEGVVTLDGLVEFVRDHTDEVLSLNQLQFSVGRLETARLAISGQTDVEHIQSLAQRHGVRDE